MLDDAYIFLNLFISLRRYIEIQHFKPRFLLLCYFLMFELYDLNCILIDVESVSFTFSNQWYYHLMQAQRTLHSKSVAGKFLGCVQASVVGLSHRFHAATGSNCAQVKILASLLGKCRENTSGTIEVLLKRNMNIPADANAVSVLVADLDEFSEQGMILQMLSLIWLSQSVNHA